MPKSKRPKRQRGFPEVLYVRQNVYPDGSKDYDAFTTEEAAVEDDGPTEIGVFEIRAKMTIRKIIDVVK